MNSLAQEKTADKQRLVLVDGSGYIWRAFHALPPLTRRDGTPVGAVYGFTTMLLRLRETYKHDMLAVIFDAGRQTFRSEFYPEYKMNRAEAPPDIVPQFPLIKEATRALNIPGIELANYEADDLIACYTRAAQREGREVVIVSSDKDLMQLIVDGEVSMMDPMKNKIITSVQVMEKFGVMPEKVIEVQALIGDSIDNVPGVPSIGPKTAAELINQFGDLEGVLAHLDQIKQPKRREVLTQHAENARLSRRLVELHCGIALPLPLSELATKPFDSAALAAFLEQQGFGSLSKKMGLASAAALEAGGEVNAIALSSRADVEKTAAISMHVPRAQATSAAVRPKVETLYEMVMDEPSLMKWINEATYKGYVAIDTETTSLNAVDAELVGISLSVDAGRACYIPLQHVSELAAEPLAQGGLFDAPKSPEKKLLPGQIPVARALELLAPLFADPKVMKIGHNLKYDLVVLEKYGFMIDVLTRDRFRDGANPDRGANAIGEAEAPASATIAAAGNIFMAIHPIADTMLMSYCVAGGLHGQGLDFLIDRHFVHKMMPYTDVCGTGKNKKNFSEVDLDCATKYAAEDADFTLRLYELMKKQLPLHKVARVYETIERPLIPVIVAMECAGIRIDAEVLKDMSAQFAVKIDALEKEIITLAGMPFSVGSPKQLGEVLFDKLQLGGAKKSSKTGAYTTDAGTLETLAEEGHEIARKVLDWRQYSKLKSTYTDSLPKTTSPRDGRIHTSYAMALTTTGRLSSSDPNLQNIPIRTEEGRKIRTAFIAEEGYVLLSADYSQIELRLLAHVAEMDSLKAAFRDGIDIHALTASQMFGVPLDQMTSDIRRRAKAINFGIIYGISAHGLSAQLGIGRAEASEYIGKYFAQYPGIREYMDKTIRFAREHGYVETLYGRRIHVKDINSKNGAFRQFSERAAINAPLQGTAADIIKLAMVEVHKAVTRHPAPGTRKARILLQVHDELVIEAPVETADALIPVIKRAMERVASLSVPLIVEVGKGRDWGSAH